MEQYYGKEVFLWTENIIIANIKTLLASAKTLYTKDIIDYDTRANLMWTSTMSLNSTTSFNSNGDWNVHAIEHSLSALWDITHGAGLALITPSYIKYRSDNESWFREKTINLAQQVFNKNSVDEFINELINFIMLLELPIKFSNFNVIKNVSSDDINYIVEHSLKYSSTLSEKVIRDIVCSIPR